MSNKYYIVKCDIYWLSSGGETASGGEEYYKTIDRDEAFEFTHLEDAECVANSIGGEVYEVEVTVSTRRMRL